MDPTYPLIPVVNLLAAFLAFLTLITNVRHSWNIGVVMLSIWLFLANAIDGVEDIVWSDDADNKAPIWCDISTHIGMAGTTAIPACSLVITRRLYNIAHLKTVEAPSKRERRKQFSIDLLIGIGIPVLVMGPFYYVVQGLRFATIEELGCSPVIITSILSFLLVNSWQVILPLISAIFYCQINSFLRSNTSVNRTKYFRVLAVGFLDIAFTLPTNALSFVQNVLGRPSIPFYPGWHYVHYPWAPESVPAEEWRADFWSRFGYIYQQWMYPFLTVVVFLLFGLTGEARAAYRRWFWAVAGFFIAKPAVCDDFPDMEFGSLPQSHSRASGHSSFMLESRVTESVDFMHSA